MRELSLALEPSAHLAPGAQRRKRSSDPVKGERIEIHVGGESQRVEPGVQMHSAGGAARGTVPVLMLGHSVEGHVPQRSVERSYGRQASLEDDGGRYAPNGMEIDIGAAHREAGEGEAAVPDCTDASLARDG